MLVLALKFSRCDRDVSAVPCHMCSGSTNDRARKGSLPQNEREDQSTEVIVIEEVNLRLSDELRLTRQCTNLESIRRPTNVGPTTLHLLRKEVIQPHLPVRLPCYDFTPITDPTFDGSFLAVRPPASGVADFRGVTGGVYKARERIHPGVLIRDY